MGMDTVELIMRIEDHFGIAIPDAETEKIDTVQDIYDTVIRHLPEGEASIATVPLVVNNIIADHAGLELWEISPEKSITNDLGLD
jgi:acyl carrier protein